MPESADYLTLDVYDRPPQGRRHLLSEALAREGLDHAVAESLSTTVVAAVEGAIILARAAHSTKPLEQVSHHLEELIALHRPTSARDRRKVERH